MILLDLLILVVSVTVLAKASSLVVDNAVKLSSYFKISQLAIGFLLIAVATSLPELSVSVVSSTVGEGAIAAGNVFGSNIANILLILGLGAFFYGFKIDSRSMKGIALVLLLTTIISVYIIFSSSIQGRALGFPEGVFLLAIFLVYAWKSMQNNSMEERNGMVSKKEALTAFLFFAGSILIVIISSGFVVESAVNLARSAGVAESFIGATLIAIGTSLPELSIDLQAIRKKKYGLALGDAIGSNMANLTLVLGTAAVLNPLVINIGIFIAALLFAVIANTVLMYVGAVHKKLDRAGGVTFLALYALYIIVIFFLQFQNL